VKTAIFNQNASKPVIRREGVMQEAGGRMRGKRRRAAALQDAGAKTGRPRTARSVPECASPLALLVYDRSFFKVAH